MNTFLFDLDGTLLTMDQEQFIQAYFQQIGAKAAALGWDAKNIVKAVWAGTQAMIKNDGTMTNHDRFWQTFASLLGEEALFLEPDFDAFYSNEFETVKSVVTPSPYPRQIIDCIKSKGYRVLLATNPLFPAVGTQARIRWAGLSKDDFDFVTTYENINYCKPNPEYYRTLLSSFSLSPSDVMMVGNDIKEDIIPTSTLGMTTYLVTDWMIPYPESSITANHQGTLEDFLHFVQSLPSIQ